MAGGSEDEASLRDNDAALARYRLLPRALSGGGAVDTSIELFGGLQKA